MSIRRVQQMRIAQPTVEGAGVRLRRGFGFGASEEFDPFLLLDDFRGERPADYEAGFTWHPHRGMETITYVLAGEVEHQDSLGNRGVLRAGDVQWMTAGSGILHQEMPTGDVEGHMEGFQLWANLPATLKMSRPRYQEIASKRIPEVVEADGARTRVICGAYGGAQGPVEGVAIEPRYLDITLPPGLRKEIPTRSGDTVFAYVLAGEGRFDEGEGERAGNPRWRSSGRARRFVSRPARQESAFCWSAASRCTSRWPGTVRS